MRKSNSDALGRATAAALLALLAGCDEVKVVSVVLKKGTSACIDDVSPSTIKVKQGRREVVVWRIENQCLGEKELTFTLKNNQPVADCGISPYQAGFSIETSFKVAQGQIRNIYCTHADRANEKDYRYRIKIAGSGETTESHELDIGTKP